LKEKNLEQLRAAIKLLNASEEAELQAIIKSFSRVVNVA
jgi:hypothetical protein